MATGTPTVNLTGYKMPTLSNTTVIKNIIGRRPRGPTGSTGDVTIISPEEFQTAIDGEQAKFNDFEMGKVITLGNKDYFQIMGDPDKRGGLIDDAVSKGVGPASSSPPLISRMKAVFELSKVEEGGRGIAILKDVIGRLTVATDTAANFEGSLNTALNNNDNIGKNVVVKLIEILKKAYAEAATTATAATAAPAAAAAGSPPIQPTLDDILDKIKIPATDDILFFSDKKTLEENAKKYIFQAKDDKAESPPNIAINIGDICLFHEISKIDIGTKKDMNFHSFKNIKTDKTGFIDINDLEIFGLTKAGASASTAGGGSRKPKSRKGKARGRNRPASSKGKKRTVSKKRGPTVRKRRRTVKRN